MSNEPESMNSLPPTADVDWFLQSLVNMANNSQMEFGITLQVSGMLVSGNLISGKAYFDGFGADFASPFSDPEVVESIKQSFSSYGDTFVSNDGNETDNRPPPQFIHLKNARFFNTAGNPIPGNRGVWWRGRLCEVGGFSLGSLQAE